MGIEIRPCNLYYSSEQVDPPVKSFQNAALYLIRYKLFNNASVFYTYYERVVIYRVYLKTNTCCLYLQLLFHSAPKLTLEKADKRSIDAASTIVSPHASCTIAQSYRPTSSVHYQEFQGDVAHEECQSARLKDEAWLTTKCISRDKTTSSSVRRTTDGVNDDGENSDPVRDEQTHCLPTWSAFNSQLARDDDSPLTCIRTMPLLASLAHEYSTLLNVFRQTQLVSDQIVGPTVQVILTMDKDLYQRALKLQIAKPEQQGRIILNICELHTVILYAPNDRQFHRR